MQEANSPRLSEACTDYLSRHFQLLREAVEAGQDGVTIAERHARVYDGLLQSLCCAADPAAERAKRGRRLALVAVGGYGRRMVAPYSDIDVLFLCDDPAEPGLQQRIERVLFPLWNAGVDVGHAVRGLDETLELARTDIRTSTTLLDLRHIAGEQEIVDELVQRGRQEIFERSLEAFLAALDQDTSSRHERFGGSLYLREPELKLGRGGLRDLDVVLWAAAAFWGTADVDALVKLGALAAFEATGLLAARKHLWTVRARLHVNSGRRQDRLNFEDQEGIAAQLGYADGVALGVEQFMQTHYRHARTIARLVDAMTERVRRASLPAPSKIEELGGGLSVRDGRLAVDPDLLAESPRLALDLYREVAERELPCDPAARDEVASAAADLDWCRQLRRDPSAAQRFCELLERAEAAPVRHGSLLEELHDTGVLAALVPELDAVTGCVSHDAYHAYTVDAQSVMAVDMLRALSRGDMAEAHVGVSRCAAEMLRPLPVHLALLLHGVGVGQSDDPPSHAAALAGVAAERLGLEASDIDYLRWLITHQATMYHWALRRDVTDPEAIAELAAQVPSPHHLRDMYLVNFICVATANPTAMTVWTARMLEDLYRAVLALLEGADRPSAEMRRQAAIDAVDDPEESAALAAFVASLPDRYALANTVEGMRFHHRVIAAERDGLAFGATPSGVGPGTLELVVATDDRPGVLADVTAALAAANFGIDWAQLYTRVRDDGPDQAFDIFHLTHARMGAADDMQIELEGLRERLLAVLHGRATAAQLLRENSAPPSWTRTGPRVRTEIHIDNATSARSTIIDVYTRDRPHLLHTIARTLHESGLSIDLAKVNTEGNRVADVFYVRTKDGGKLAGRGRVRELSGRLRSELAALDAVGKG
jgi:[protein-PII] uridylyltransferase